ncbi:MAG TPA: hypothetical protein VK966_10995 [Longimicrobiales bacterium]|nr:hypothetical protein [Longimicrobiales bacterium]
MPKRIVPILLLLVTAACAQGDPGAENGDSGALPAPAPDTETATPTPDPDRTPGEDRPGSRSDTVYLEGMPEPMELTLFRTPQGFPLAFSAYVPSDFEAEREAEDAVQFVAAFGGQRNEDAFVHVYIHPEGTDEQAAVGTIRTFGSSRGIPVSMGIEPMPAEDVTQTVPWADRAFTFRYQGDPGWITGTMALGQHDGRYFHIVTHYPAEYGDGIGPRVAKILETWEWADGTPLTAAGS